MIRDAVEIEVEACIPDEREFRGAKAFRQSLGPCTSCEVGVCLGTHWNSARLWTRPCKMTSDVRTAASEEHCPASKRVLA